MEYFKYLIRIPNHLGDTIMAQPAVAAFIQAKESEAIALLVPEWAEPIFESLGAAKILKLAPARLHGLSAIYYQVRLLREYEIENSVLLTPSFSSALVMFASGIKNRFGYTGDGRQLLLNNCLTLSKNSVVHRSEKYQLLLEKTGEQKLELRSPCLSISDSKKNEAVAILENHGIDPADKYVVIAPQAVAESRRWGTANYSALAGRLINNYNLKIALIGTADQYEAGQKIAGVQKNIVNLCGKTDIEQAAAVLAGAIAFIGNDSGLAHLASAVDIRLIILSGADDPNETSPVSDKKTVIIKNSLECISCVKNICPKSGDKFMLCMRQISVEEIIDAL